MEREALKLALEVLEQLQGGCTDHDDGTVEAITVWCPEVIDAIKEALAQQAQEPVEITHKHEWLRTGEMKFGQARCISCGVWSQEEATQPAQEPDEWLTGCPECGMDNGCDCDSGTWNPPQPAQEPVAWAVYDKRGGSKSLHWPEQHSPDGDANMFNAVPLVPQRTWVEPRGDEWFNWWRVSKVADETEAEIDFADFITIALAVSAKLKEMNT